MKAYCHFYREDGRYNERTSVWIERIGLEKVKEIIVNDKESRKRMVKKMDIYLSSLTDDPWETRIKAVTSDQSEMTDDYKPIDIARQAEI